CEIRRPTYSASCRSISGSSPAARRAGGRPSGRHLRGRRRPKRIGMSAPRRVPEPAREPRLRALLLDDDPYALEFLRAILAERYPGLDIDVRTEPDPTGEYDLYLLDDDFEGVRLAGKLARRIRAQRPEALILAFSASLDGQTLKDLLGAGCNGVCDK